MKVNGKKRLIKRVACFARALNVYSFDLTIKKSDSASYCQRHEDGTFTIAIQPGISKYWQHRHLAHEMVHLRQYKHDELRSVEGGYTWKGEFFADREYLSDTYFLQPWEIEARGLEDWLMHKWRNRKRELH